MDDLHWGLRGTFLVRHRQCLCGFGDVKVKCLRTGVAFRPLVCYKRGVSKRPYCRLRMREGI